MYTTAPYPFPCHRSPLRHIGAGGPRRPVPVPRPGAAAVALQLAAAHQPGRAGPPGAARASGMGGGGPPGALLREGEGGGMGEIRHGSSVPGLIPEAGYAAPTSSVMFVFGSCVVGGLFRCGAGIPKHVSSAFGRLHAYVPCRR